MYEVEINADPEHFLDWDKPLSEQSEHVGGALRALGAQPPESVEAMQARALEAVNTLRGRAKASWVDPALDDVAGDISKATTPADVYLAMKDVPLGFGVNESSAFADVAGSFNDALAYLKAHGDPRDHTNIMGKVYGGLGDPTEASKKLLEQGVLGIKYFDGGSRAAGDGSRNYVTFSDEIVSIVKKYGIAGLAMLPPAVLMQNGIDPASVQGGS
jgi:hypothetical protein